MSYNKFDVIMKVLEIIEHDEKIGHGTVTGERITQVTNFIAHMEGNLINDQTERKEILVEGDKFENISQSIIATRGSIAKGIIGVRERHGDNVANALKVIETALTGEAAGQMPQKTREEALDLLAEISQQGAKPDASKSVLRSLGQALWNAIEKIEPLSTACLAAWKVVEKIWV